MTVSIRCTKCGILGFFSYDKNHVEVSKIVNEHKMLQGRKHRVLVDRT